MEKNIYKIVIQILLHDDYCSLPEFHQLRIEAFGDEFDDEQKPDLPPNDWVRAVWKYLYWNEDMPGLTL